jgi:hypothetical protein
VSSERVRESKIAREEEEEREMNRYDGKDSISLDHLTEP